MLFISSIAKVFLKIYLINTFYKDFEIGLVKNILPSSLGGRALMFLEF